MWPHLKGFTVSVLVTGKKQILTELKKKFTSHVDKPTTCLYFHSRFFHVRVMHTGYHMHLQARLVYSVLTFQDEYRERFDLSPDVDDVNDTIIVEKISKKRKREDQENNEKNEVKKVKKKDEKNKKMVATGTAQTKKDKTVRRKLTSKV